MAKQATNWRRLKCEKNEDSAVLQEAESGETVIKVCRRHGISQQSFYLWKNWWNFLDTDEPRSVRRI